MKHVIIAVSALMVLSGAGALVADPNMDLASAIAEGNVAAARTAIRAGAKLRGKDTYFLHQACSGGNAGIISLLLENKIDVNRKTPEGETALMSAVNYPPKVDAARLLVKAGADVNATNRRAQSPLLLAAQNMTDIEQYAEIASFLLASGARPDDRDDKGMTALMWASGQGSPVIVRLLLASRADVNLKDANGMTALMFAANFSQRESVEALIGAGAKVNEQDGSGWSPLLHAIKGAFEPGVVNYLISKGAMVSLKAEGGWTPLMEAATGGKPEIVRALVKAKAEVNAKSGEGRTALGYASMMIIRDPGSPFRQVVNILRSAGGR